MRKAYHLLFVLFCLGALTAKAQPTCDPVTHTTGTVTLPNGINVTVTGPGNTSTTQCGGAVAPYQIGRSVSDAYTFSFAPAITHAVYDITRLHDNDTVQFFRNGLPYALTPGDIGAANAACAVPTAGTWVITADGRLTSNGTPAGTPTSLTVTIQAPPFGTLMSTAANHDSKSINTLADDVIFGLCAKDDSCSLSFEVSTPDTSACSGTDFPLEATEMPNSIYFWRYTPFGAGGLNPVFSNPNDRKTNVVNPNSGMSGWYVSTAVRGQCVYTDSIAMYVYLSPTLGPVRQAGPKCPNQDDTLRIPQINLPAGGWAVIYGSAVRNPNTGGTIDTPEAGNNYEYYLKNIQPEQANVPYYFYAIDANGCASDTTEFIPRISPKVKANFEFVPIEGRFCQADTVIFRNKSTTDSNRTISSFWYFDDLSPNSPIDTTLAEVVHYYKKPVPNWIDTTYQVRLFVSNGSCGDTTSQAVFFDTRIRAHYKIVDEIVNMCQGKLVQFDAEDSTFVKPGTTPKFAWDFKDGDSSFTLNTEHTFNLAGEFNPTLIVEDFLGCKDSFSIKIIVDSAGFVNFSADKQEVCVGDEIKFNGDYSDYGYESAVWNFGDGVTKNDSRLLNHSFREPGTYKVTFDVSYRLCDDVHYEGDYIVKPIPTVYIGEDTSLCMNGAEIKLKDLYNEGNPLGIKYQWNTPNRDKTSDVIVRHHGSYSLTADLNGCIASDTINIRKNCYIDIPNVFTPNGDGNGDYFLPRQTLSSNVRDFEMHIYNRWGKKVFETTSNNGRGWDGKLGGDDQPVGVYIYVIDVSFGNGTTERYQGNVTLLR